MGNYDKMAAMAAELFLKNDQEELLARYPLEADEQFLYLTFLGDRYRVDRTTGEVLGGRPPEASGAVAAAYAASAPCVPDASADSAVSEAGEGLPRAGLATPRQTLIVMDMVCNPVGAPGVSGSWITMAQASGASNSPSASSLFEELIATFEGDAGRLQAACDAIGAKPCPGGEVSCLIDIFDNYPVWLQFWDGDDEFPAQMKFLWDRSVRLYLHFETMWYILYEILEKLIARSEPSAP